MNMSTWAIRKPVPSIALFMVLMIIGMVSFFQLPVTRFPNIDIPVITIGVAQAGAAPSEIATQIVEPIESAVFDVTGVKHVNSTSNDSSASIMVEFELGIDTDRALNDIKNAVASVRGDLPEDMIEPVIKQLDVTGQPILYYAVSDQTQSIEGLSQFVDEVLARDLQAGSGVGKVARLGGSEREISVELDLDRLIAQGVTAANVSTQLRGKNINLGGGRGELEGQEFSIRTLGSAQNVKDLAATPINVLGGAAVRLDSLGTVTDGGSEMRQFAMYNGQSVVAFAVWRSSGASDLTAAESAKEKLAEIQEKHPNLTVALISDDTVYTEGNYASAMETLFEGAILAIIVVLLFLRNWRATLITAFALPLSIIPTFFVMQYLGFTLNTISLLGITLVTGILVDDAIVEIENIVRHIQMGKSAYQASEEAATEIGTTVIAISLTIVAVFAPVSFMSGIAGQYFKQFGLTVAIAVLFSLLVARLITPMMAAYFMKDKGHDHEIEDGFIMNRYMRILKWTLHNRFITLVCGIAIFGISIFSATLLPSEFIPYVDRGASSVKVELPTGTVLGDTATISQEITRRILEIKEVQNVFVDGGSGGINYANMVINFGQKDTRSRTAKEIEADILQRLHSIPDVKINILRDDGTRDISIKILGDKEEATASAANQLVEEMSGLDKVKNVASGASLTRPEIQITPKAEVAAQLGVNAVSLANTIRVATLGDSSGNLAKFNAGDRQIPIVVRLNANARNDLTKLASQRLDTNSGGQVPLGVVADIKLTTGVSSIERYDRQYTTTINADLAGDTPLGTALEEVNNLPTSLKMPEGTKIQQAGDAEVMGEVFTAFGLAMGTGILLVYVVLVLLFSSFLTPITILASLPLAIGGAILALYLCNYAIGLSVVIGFLMLMGIVTKNAIMLVEFAVERMSHGVSKFDAVLDAGHKRARPIVMTTIAMAAGMLPSAMAFGTGGEFRSPMAVGVIGGLLLSTLLSLLFVPSMFSVVHSVRVRAKRGLVTVLGANVVPQNLD